MGQTLSEPVTEKHTTVVVRGKQYWVGLSDMQGWRISMEDAHSVHLYMPSPKSSSAPIEPSSETIPEQPTGSTVTNNSPDNQDGNALFGVFDGHGGSTVAKFAGTTLHKRLSDSDAYKSGDYDKALKETFLKTDEDLRADASFFNDPSGCTAVVGLITQDGRIIVANSGDSRSVLGYKGEAKAMSHDHKPTNKEETARITSAGGFVEFGRVNGNLALSRALGDFEFKQNHSLEPEKQIVTADPDIITHKIDGEEEFLVLACDGIWDCLTSQQVIDFTRRAIANGDDLGKICEDMMKKCTATESDTGGIGCDNMTVIVVALLNGRTPEEWQQWVKERVEKKHGYDTPASVPDIFGQTQGRGLTGGVTSGMGIGGGAGGFRVAGAGGLANIASILGASGITFKPSDDSDEDEDDEDDLQIIGDESQSDVPESKIKEINQNSYIDDKGLKGDTKPSDVTDKLDSTSALDTDSQSGSVRLVDEDGDSTMDSGDDSDETTTGEPSAPAKSSGTKTPNFTSVGSPNVPPHKELLPLDGKIGGGKQSNKDRLNDSSDQKQFETVPLGDEPSAAVGTEGLMDTSENPTKM